MCRTNLSIFLRFSLQIHTRRMVFFVPDVTLVGTRERRKIYISFGTYLGQETDYRPHVGERIEGSGGSYIRPWWLCCYIRPMDVYHMINHD